MKNIIRRGLCLLLLLAMTAAMAACGCEGPVTVLGSECVAKSYPAFWEDFASLKEDAV